MCVFWISQSLVRFAESEMISFPEIEEVREQKLPTVCLLWLIIIFVKLCTFLRQVFVTQAILRKHYMFQKHNCVALKYFIPPANEI